MLIGNSLPEYIFIRIVILGLRIIAPLSITYTLLRILAVAISDAKYNTSHAFDRYRLPLALEIYLFLEAAFFFVVYLPLRTWLQYAATHPEALRDGERRALFQRILDSVTNVGDYLSGWFLGVQAESIERENMKEFLAWSLMNEHAEKLTSDESNEIDDYVAQLERKLGRPFKSSGRTTKSLRTTFDSVPMQHRPLIWYLVGEHRRLLVNQGSPKWYRSYFSWTLSPISAWLLARSISIDHLCPHLWRSFHHVH